MIIRIVNMTFQEESLTDFHKLFEGSAPSIRSFPGCMHLELWRNVDCPFVLSTYSVWESSDALEQYRSSKLFKTTWASAKALFSEPATASSHELIFPEEPPPSSERNARSPSDFSPRTG